MKTITCNQLGGACDHEFHAENFDELTALSKNHVMEMIQKGDQPHLAAIQKMQHLMTDPEGMNQWMEEKKKQFDALPNND